MIYCRYYLGLGKRAPNLAVQGDMGWGLPEEKQWLCVVRMWLRLCNMNDSQIGKKVFKWCKSLSTQKKKNWYFRCENYIRNLGFNQLLNLESGIRMQDVKEDFIKQQLIRREEMWISDVNSERGQTKQGGNKLRTYKLFKLGFGVEEYVKINMPKKYRRAMAQFRAGVASINLELLRYGPGKKPLEERSCIVCTEEIEDECHVITQCPLYRDVRSVLFQKISSHVCNFNEMTEVEKMCYVLSNKHCVRIAAKSLYEILCRRKDVLLT